MIFYLVRCSAGSKTKFLLFDHLGECSFSAEETSGLLTILSLRLSLLNREGIELLSIRRTATPTGWRCSAQRHGSTVIQIRRNTDGTVASIRTREGHWRVSGDPRTGQYELLGNGETVLRCSHCQSPQGREATKLEIFSRTHPLAALAAAVMLSDLPILRTPVIALNGQ